MTSPSPSPASGSAEPTTDPNRPAAADAAAWFDALAAEHAAIYGYGLVSAHTTPDDNELVSAAIAEHRDRREAAVALLTQRSIAVPLPAAGYQLPFTVDSPSSAAKLAVRMEKDCAVAWRAVLEQASAEDTAEEDRRFGVTALTQCAVTAARWRRATGAWPMTEPFPGGSE